MPLMAQTGVGGIALPVLNFGARCGCVVNVIPRPLYPWERHPAPVVQEAGWALGPIWTGFDPRPPNFP
jgi:hypothetical protein